MSIKEEEDSNEMDNNLVNNQNGDNPTYDDRNEITINEIKLSDNSPDIIRIALMGIMITNPPTVSRKAFEIILSHCPNEVIMQVFKGIISDNQPLLILRR